jgi:hypothetical protein
MSPLSNDLPKFTKKKRKLSAYVPKCKFDPIIHARLDDPAVIMAETCKALSIGGHEKTWEFALGFANGPGLM